MVQSAWLRGEIKVCERERECVCVCACVRVCVREHVRVCARESMCVYVCVACACIALIFLIFSPTLSYSSSSPSIFITLLLATVRTGCLCNYSVRDGY